MFCLIVYIWATQVVLALGEELCRTETEPMAHQHFVIMLSQVPISSCHTSETLSSSFSEDTVIPSPSSEFLFVSCEQDGGGIFSWSWLTEDSCLPVLWLGSEVPQDSTRSREEKGGQAEGRNPAGWQAGCHVYPSSLRTEGGSDLEVGTRESEVMSSPVVFWVV
ncbi:hypothetical protein AOLI_G00278170 [Acnodon oligacanthus]